MIKILGVHSNVLGSAGLKDGHAWISVHYTNGNLATVGLWTDSLTEPRRFVRDPIGIFASTAEHFDVRWDEELKRNYKALVSRFYGLSSNGAHKAIKALGHYTGWRYTNTCASFASYVVGQVTGEKLGVSDHGLETPRALAHSIAVAEGRERTSLAKPRQIRG